MVPSTAAVRFCVLGELTVVIDGRVVHIGRDRAAIVLACLLQDVGRPKSVEALIASVWTAEAPATAATMIHGMIARLRTLLEPDRGRGAGRLIAMRGGNYVLEAPEGIDTDAAEFERLLARGRKLMDSAPSRADRLLADALRRWRGRAYAGLDHPFVHAEVHRLEELRLRCLNQNVTPAT